MSVAVPFPNLFLFHVLGESSLLIAPSSHSWISFCSFHPDYHLSTANTQIYISNLDLAPEFLILIQLLTLHLFLDIHSF